MAHARRRRGARRRPPSQLSCPLFLNPRTPPALHPLKPVSQQRPARSAARVALFSSHRRLAALARGARAALKTATGARRLPPARLPPSLPPPFDPLRARFVYLCPPRPSLLFCSRVPVRVVPRGGAGFAHAPPPGHWFFWCSSSLFRWPLLSLWCAPPPTCAPTLPSLLLPLVLVVSLLAPLLFLSSSRPCVLFISPSFFVCFVFLLLLETFIPLTNNTPASFHPPQLRRQRAPPPGPLFEGPGASLSLSANAV